MCVIPLVHACLRRNDLNLRAIGGSEVVRGRLIRPCRHQATKEVGPSLSTFRLESPLLLQEKRRGLKWTVGGRICECSVDIAPSPVCHVAISFACFACCQRVEGIERMNVRCGIRCKSGSHTRCRFQEVLCYQHEKSDMLGMLAARLAV